MFSRGPFSCAKDDMIYLLRWTVFLWIVNSIRLTSGMTVNERIDHTCPSIKLEEKWYTSVSTHKEFTGFDLAEKFLLRKGTVTENRALFKLGSKALYKSTELVFPGGLSHEYSIITTFRLRRTTKRDRWFVVQVFDKDGDTQVSLIVDGAKKSVEFLAQGFLKNSLLYVFKNRDLHALFDRQFHKLGVSVESNAVTVYLDCKLIERQVTAERAGMDLSGRTFITTRVEDGRPVDIELQEILILCDARISDLDRCCDSPEVTCEPIITHKPTAAPLVTGYFHRMLSLPAQQPTDRCHCPSLKGNRGLLGMAGHFGQKGDTGLKGDPGPQGPPGVKGDKGDPGTSGLGTFSAEKQGQKGDQGLQGDPGEKGDAGLPGQPGAEGKEGKRGRRGKPGEPGTPGTPGPPGTCDVKVIKGEKGDPGITGMDGQKGGKGDPGLPGQDGVDGIKGQKGEEGPRGPPGPVMTAHGLRLSGSGESGEKGQKGDQGERGFEGPRGLKGDTGLPGPSGTPGPEGKVGPPGPIGLRGLPGDMVSTSPISDMASIPISINYYEGLGFSAFSRPTTAAC
nr:collagen alpha-1(XXII) chain [Misgurnus anguillicaudatus]